MKSIGEFVEIKIRPLWIKMDAEFSFSAIKISDKYSLSTLKMAN